MPDSPAYDVQAAIASLRAEQTRIQAATDRMTAVTGSSSSKDRMVTATVDGQGRLVELKLTGTRYRQLAPVELAARIARTVRSAQDDAARTAATALAELLPAGLGLPIDGGLDLGAMFDTAVSAMASDGAPEGEHDPR
ncbi:YbaB/EbfC family nucleoid-associated protein [Actinomadura sp. DC4]|uniref:YbaB/EbfC family nucleoid-associated protein n=1 Tax=Actinomadura sp. DC4 TaxID=3055069 RepID=UPI0025AF24EE|nr:YbaB/EbfC family nucleoid-associated protein [Actinomadura sp. DC4]MDN3358994.1 YbaB/EbfC family nucleoid-associated protein [Actinomadura sp. DC4]